DVLLGDRVVFLLHQLVGHGARVLTRHVVETGVGARDELHLDRGGLGHWEPLLEFGRTLAAGAGKSRKAAVVIVPSPLVGEGYSELHRRRVGEGFLRRKARDPSPNRVSRAAGVALSHRGRGHKCTRSPHVTASWAIICA